MGEKIRVGMADLNVCRAPDSILTLGLGSCVGVVLYDMKTRTAGMLHAMLPDSTQIRNNSNRAKFADTGMDDLIRRLELMGVRRSDLKAKMAGGAQMFSFSANNEMSSIGMRNVIAARSKLREYGIPLIAEDTGANYGRTIEFYPENGKLEIRAVGKEIIYI